MCHGNALFEIQKEYGFNLVAAAYVPTKHTYTEDKEFDGYSRLDCIVQKILNPAPITIASDIPSLSRIRVSLPAKIPMPILFHLWQLVLTAIYLDLQVRFPKR